MLAVAQVGGVFVVKGKAGSKFECGMLARSCLCAIASSALLSWHIICRLMFPTTMAGGSLCYQDNDCEFQIHQALGEFLSTERDMLKQRKRFAINKRTCPITSNEAGCEKSLNLHGKILV
jgi:hypothetical protein